MSLSKIGFFGFLFFFLFAGAAFTVHADEPESFLLVMKDHHFVPETLTVPANEKIKLRVQNQDPEEAEFESSDLNREKVVSGQSDIFVFVGPLVPGRYKFSDDFHASATGILIAQ